MEEKLKWNEPSELVLLDTVKAINALDAVRIGIGAENFDMMSMCSLYMPPIKNSFKNLIDVAAVSLGFTEISEGGVKRFVKGSLLADDFFEIDRDEFTEMIYRCRYDTEMLHTIYNAFVNHTAEDISKVAASFVFSL